MLPKSEGSQPFKALSPELALCLAYKNKHSKWVMKTSEWLHFVVESSHFLTLLNQLKLYCLND